MRAQWILIPAAFALLATPLAVPLLRRVLGQEGTALNPALGGTARLLLVYSALLAAALVWAAL